MTILHFGEELDIFPSDYDALYNNMYTTVSVDKENGQTYNAEELSLEVV